MSLEACRWSRAKWSGILGLVAVWGIVTAACAEVNVSLTNGSGKPSDQVVVGLQVDSNPDRNIAVLSLDILFDSTLLSLVSRQRGTALETDEMVIVDTATPGIIKIVITDLALVSDPAFGMNDGTAYQLTFQIQSKAQAGNTSLKLSNLIAVDRNSQQISKAKTTDGKITIDKAPPSPDVTSPTIQGLNPIDEAVVVSTPITLTGIVTDDQSAADEILFMVDQDVVSLNPAGDFTHQIHLKDGKNQLKLTAEDKAKNKTIVTHSIILQTAPPPPPPKPNLFTLQLDPAEGIAPLKVRFSVGTPQNILPMKYEWDLDGLGRFDLVAYEPELEYTYQAPSDYLETTGGNYLPTVRITYEENQDMKTITLSGLVSVKRDDSHSPTVTLKANVNRGQAPLLVHFQAVTSGSSSPLGGAEGNIVAYRWDLDGDGVFEYHSHQLSELKTFYREVKSYTPTVEVMDMNGYTARDSLLVSVDSDPKIATPKVGISTQPQKGVVPLQCMLNGTTDTPAASYQFDIDGDGVVDITPPNPQSGGVYYDVGIYNPSLRVVSSNGVAASADTQVEVLTQPNFKRPQITVTVSEKHGNSQKVISNASSEIRLPGMAIIELKEENSGVTIDRVELDFEGDGKIDRTSPWNGNGKHDSRETFMHRYHHPGHYLLMARAISTDGIEFRRYVPISVLGQPIGEKGSLVWIHPNKDDLTIKGERLTLVVASICQVTPTEVSFEYRPLNQNWQNIGVSKRGPHYSIEWHLTALAVGQYEVNAKALLSDGSVIETEPIPILIDSTPGKGDVEEGTGANGQKQSSHKTKPEEENYVILPEGIEVTVSAQTVQEETSLVIRSLNSGEVSQTIVDSSDPSIKDIQRYWDISFDNGVKEFSKPIIITMEYADDDQDGIVDGTQVPEEGLKAYRYDGTSWYRLQAHFIDPVANTVVFETNHFSIFGLGGSGDGGSGGSGVFGVVESLLGGGGGGGGCFIATAAYGSSLAPEVKILRTFRDRCLMNNPLGRVLVQMYYQVSPPVADFIREREFAKQIVRWLMKPVIWGVRAYLDSADKEDPL